jgi:hypothetical protein
LEATRGAGTTIEAAECFRLWQLLDLRVELRRTDKIIELLKTSWLTLGTFDDPEWAWAKPEMA